MNIGMNLPVMVPGLDRNRILEWCRRIDSGPYSSLAVGERVTFPNPEAMVTISAAAAITERVRLALTVIILPMHAAPLMAKQIATLDVISGGRVTLGVGVGARPEDFHSAGATFEKKRLGKMESQIAVMRRAWNGEIVVEGAKRPIEPYPVQKGGPELLAGSLQPNSIKRAARWADGICGFSFGPSIEEIDASFNLARSAWKENKRERPPRLITSFWYALGDNARSQLDDYIHRYLAFMGEDTARALAPIVTTVSAQGLKDVVKRLEDIGTDELLLVPTTLDPDEVNRVADILG